MMETLTQWATWLNDMLWSDLLMALLLGCALWFTLKSRFVSFRMIPEMFRLVLRSGKKQNGISSFEAFIISLAGRVGTGNLAGVATAVVVGGPGAVFWMWLIAILGSATAFFECTLAQLYKVKGEKNFVGGPAYYMLHGARMKDLATFFALLSAVCFGVAYNSVHSNTICAACQQAFSVDPHVLGGFLFVMTLLIIFGGIQRIAKVSSILVPIMACGYILLAFVVIALNIDKIPGLFQEIIGQAFGLRPMVGGGLGAAFLQGIRRGLYSNEAGMGTSPNVAATAVVSHPVKQGLIQAFGVFVDTLVICTATAFIILVSPVQMDGSVNGIQLTQLALENEIGFGATVYIACTVLMFAFSTILSNYYYGESNLRFFTQNKTVLLVYRIMAAGVVFFGSIASLELAWSLADIATGVMTLCNLIAIVFLTRPVVRLLKDYVAQRRQGKDPEYKLSNTPEIEGDVTCW